MRTANSGMCVHAARCCLRTIRMPEYDACLSTAGPSPFHSPDTFSCRTICLSVSNTPLYRGPDAPAWPVWICSLTCNEHTDTHVHTPGTCPSRWCSTHVVLCCFGQPLSGLWQTGCCTPLRERTNLDSVNRESAYLCSGGCSATCDETHPLWLILVFVAA